MNMVIDKNINVAMDKPVSGKVIGRPTNEAVHFRKELHAHNELMRECHQRVISLEGRLLMQSNLIQKQSLEIGILRRNLDVSNRM